MVIFSDTSQCSHSTCVGDCLVDDDDDDDDDVDVD